MKNILVFLFFILFSNVTVANSVYTNFFCDDIQQEITIFSTIPQIHLYSTKGYNDVDLKLNFGDEINRFTENVNTFFELASKYSLLSDDLNRHCQSIIKYSNRENKNSEYLERQKKTFMTLYFKGLKRHVKFVNIKGCESVAEKISELYLLDKEDLIERIYIRLYRNCLERNRGN